ncbi:MAG: TRAP transporter substrate-binding protein [Nevskiales bacterium]
MQECSLIRSRRSVVTAGLAGAALLAAPTILRAQARVAKVSVLVNEDHPSTITWNKYAKTVAEKTGGAVQIKVYPNAQLGDEKSVAEGMRIGSIEGSTLNVAVLSAWVPEGQLFDMPFVFKSLEHGSRVMAGPIGQRMAAKYQPFGFRVLGYWNNGVRHPLGRFEINTPADVKGKKMRVIESPLHIALWSLLGANPTPLPAPEIYNALQTGVIDFLDNSKSSYLSLRFYEVAPYFTDLGHIYSYAAFTFSDIFWKRLTPVQQEILRTEAAQAIIDQDRLAAAADETALAKTVTMGTKVTRPDHAPWEAAMKPFWEKFAANVGGMGAIQEILAA